MPERLNWFLLAVSAIATAACLWLASHGTWWAAIAGAIAFAFLNNIPFALMHEAVHGVASPSRRRNDLLGAIAGWMFPTSFSLQRTAHLGHHLRNRTDQELYDYYTARESRALRNVWLYAGNLFGLYWFLIPLSNVIYLIGTPLYRSKLFVERIAPALGFGTYVNDIVRLPAARVRLEIAAAIAYQASLWWLLDLNLLGWILAHWLFALHWSALQYVDHAWSARDVTNGAWDLRVSTPARWLALNYHCHLAHHRNPQVPWTRLPSLATREGQPTFWQVYWSLWRNGVQPAPPMGAPANASLLAAAEKES
jgi:fatty acid desaturase